jgi:hypothetical protein
MYIVIYYFIHYIAPHQRDFHLAAYIHRVLQYTIVTDNPGGIYATATMRGSRGAADVASSWATLMCVQSFMCSLAWGGYFYGYLFVGLIIE